MELEREKVGLLKDVCGLLREAADRDKAFQDEIIILKRAKLNIAAHRLALEEEKLGQPQLSIILPEHQGDAYFQYILRYFMWMLGKLNYL